MTTHPKPAICPGCGGPLEEYTPGCPRCSTRHSRWRATGHPDAKDPIPGKTTCAKCGCLLDKFNPNCGTCRKRAYSRAKRDGRPANLPPRTSPKQRTTEEIRTTTERNREALDAWLRARRERLKNEPPTTRATSFDTADLISENHAVELTGVTRCAIRRAVKNGDLECRVAQHGAQTRRFLSRTQVIIWATRNQKGKDTP